MPTRKKPRLAPLPDGADPTSAAIVVPLLEQFVLELPDAYIPSAEGVVFRDLLEAAYPAAWKDYQEHHWKAHFGAVIERVQSEVTHRAKRQARLHRAIKSAGGKNGVVDDDHPVMKFANANGKGVWKRVMGRTRPELLSIARRYESSGHSRLLMAAFNRELASRLVSDDETVADHWSKEEVVELLGETFQDEELPTDEEEN